MVNTNGTEQVAVSDLNQLETALMQINTSLSRLQRYGGASALHAPGTHMQTDGSYGRDFNTILGYPSTVADEEMASWFERNPIARRVVNLPVGSSWKRRPPVLAADDPQGEAEFSRAFAQLATDSKLWEMLTRVDKLSRMGDYAVLLIGFDDAEEGAAQANPLGAGVGKVSDTPILYLQVYGSADCDLELGNDPTNERYRLPVKYTITMLGDDGTPGPAVEVHWRRIIHVVDEPLKSDVYGNPVMRLVYNTLLDEMKVSGGSAEASWRRISQKFIQRMAEGTRFDPDNADDAAAVARIKTQLDAMIHNLTSTTILQGVEDVQMLGGEMVDPSGLWDVVMTKIAMGTGVPKRLLMGSELGSLASSQDAGNYADTIAGRQSVHCESHILRPFIDRCIEVGALPEPPNGYTVGVRDEKTGEWRWPRITEQTDAEEATTAQARSAALAALQGAAAAGANISPDEVRAAGGLPPVGNVSAENQAMTANSRQRAQDMV